MNIKKEYQNLQIWMQLIPTILGLIEMIEQTFPALDGKGKLAMLRLYLADVFGKFAEFLGSLDDNWPRIEKLVADTVAILKKAGLFKSAKPDATKVV